jgi:GT2 family glycosyltransferase
MSTARLSIGITTRDRPESLRRCLRSLQLVSHLSPEVLVFDDGSVVPVSQQIAGAALPVPVRVIRDDRAPGYIVGRNRLVREASAPIVLLMDDDAALFDNGAIDRGIRLLESDSTLGAIAFAQADAEGTPWDDSMQQRHSRQASLVPSFIGFAHLLRHDVFARVGAYRESFEFYCEEKDFCLRLMDAGYRVVYLPDALVMHQPDPSGRCRQKYLRYLTRNDCLNALYNEPWRRLIWILPAKFALFFRMRRTLQVDDPWGWAWVLRELCGSAGAVMRDRRPVSTATVELWKRLRHAPEPYEELKIR